MIRPLRYLARGLALVLVVANTAAAVAQTAAPATVMTEDASNVVTELEAVQVHLPGPAMWRVSRGDSEVVILGFVRPLPHMLDWQQARIVHALDGAHALLVPPEPQLGVLDTVGYLFTAGRFQIPHGQTLQQVLPPADYQTYLRNIALLKGDSKHYTRWKPAVAGVAMIGDYRRAAGLSSEKPVSTVERLARQMRVPVRTMGRLKAAPLVKIVLDLSDSQSLSCFHREMEQLEWEAHDAATAAAAWGNGNVAALRQMRARSVVAECLEDLKSIQALTEQGTADAVSVMDNALSRPGRTVALVDMRYLDRSNGLLERLKAKGAVVSVPN